MKRPAPFRLPRPATLAACLCATLTSPAAVEFVGVAKPQLAAVRDGVEAQLQLETDPRADAPLADDLAYFVQSFYRNAGFAEAQVDWSLAGTNIVLTVTEGPRHIVGTVTFPGATEFPDTVLREHLLSPSHERQGPWTKPLPFVQTDIDAGVRQVERWYQASGYLTAHATNVVMSDATTPGLMNLSVPIVAGPRSEFGAVTLTGPDAADAAALREVMGPTLAEPYSEVRQDALRQSLEDWYRNRGHFLASVTAEAQPHPERGGRVPVTFVIVPGPLHTVEDIVIAPGLSRGAARVTRSLLRPLAGNVYLPASAALRQRQVLDTGIFSRLGIDPQTSGPGRLRLNVTGEEGPPKSFGVYGGYETGEGPILGVEYRDVNLWNLGDSLRVTGEKSGAGWNASAKWTDPAILGSVNAFDAQLFGLARERPGYHEQTFGLRTSLNRRPNPHLTLGVNSSFSTHAVETVGLTPAELGPTNYRLLTLGGQVTLDHRNSPIAPTRGWFASGMIESGLGALDASIAYLKTDLSAAWYHPLSERWRVAAGVRWGIIQSADGVDGLPADLRFYNGGPTTVRSFTFQRLGPINAAGVPLGGLGYDVASLELSRRVVENFEVALFVDAGTLSREGSGLSVLPQDPRYAVGLGLRYLLPVGPVRIDYGFNPARRSGEAMGALHITFGFAF